MVKHFLFLFLLFLISTYSFSQKVQQSGIPDWVEVLPINTEGIQDPESGEGFRSIRVERQVNLAEKKLFIRNAYQVFTSDGVMNNSEIEIEYDPSFQSFFVHEISIYRNGRKIDKFDPGAFKLIQKETSADRHIYDGSITALLHLSDVQKGDIIVYSYSLNGFNPVYGKYHSGFFVHQYYSKVESFFFRILVPTNQDLKIQSIGHEYKPEISTIGNLKEYQWEHAGLTPLISDNNVPYWDLTYPVTSYSTFPSWESVVDWAMPLYSYSESGLSNRADQISSSELDSVQLLEMIRYVQDEIRYLGLESGMSGYKPNPPQKVFDQKYGDCKDKSLLLVAMMRQKGIEAYPVLVSTDYKGNVAAFDANPNSFNHCVVTYQWDGKDYYVDPTISDQGGGLKNIYFPDYQKGLVLKPGVKELVTIPTGEVTSQLVEEEIIAASYEEPARFLIKTEYRGRRADEMRSSFMNSTLDEISKNYLNYYSTIYPSIELESSIKFEDDSRNGVNVITTWESYSIPDFWTKSEENQNLWVGEIYPLELESRLNFPQTATREMDYFVGLPEEFTIQTKIKLPDDWSFRPENEEIESNGFNYQSWTYSQGDEMTVKYKFQLLKTSIPGDQVAKLLTDQNKIKNNLGYSLSHADSSSGSLNLIPFCLSGVFFLGLFFVCRKVFVNFNPAPQSKSYYDSIGGWLVLPAISLVFFPLLIAYNLILGEYYISGSWSAISIHGIGFQIYYLSNFLYLHVFLAYSILTAFFFFNLRSGAPNMVIILLVVNLITRVLEIYLVDQHFDFLGLNADYVDLSRNVIGLFIWVPYFSVSVRVKETFTRTYKSDQKRSNFRSEIPEPVSQAVESGNNDTDTGNTNPLI